MRRIAIAISVVVLCVAVAFAAEVRKVGKEDVAWGDPASTWVSTGGVTRHYIPWFGDNTANTLYASDLLTLGPWVDARRYGFHPDNTAVLNTAALTAAIAYASPMRKPVFIPPGNYSIDNATRVNILDNTMLIGAGRDLVKLTVSGGNNGVQVSLGSYPDDTKISNIYISGITFVGTKPPLVASGGSFSNHALYFNYVSDVVVENCRFKYYGTQVYFNGNAGAANNNDVYNIIVRNNEFVSDSSYTPAIGVQVHAANGFDVSGNVFDNISRCISLEQPAGGSEVYDLLNGTINNNRFRGGKTSNLSATNTYGGILLAADAPNIIRSVAITGNSFYKTNTDNASTGFDIQVQRPRSNAITVTGNTHTNQNHWGVIVYDAEGVTVNGDTFHCDNSSLYTCKGIFIQGALERTSINGVVFSGQMSQDFSTGLTNGLHSDISLTGMIPSGVAANGINIQDTDNVTILGVRGLPTHYNQIYVNGSDNIVYYRTNASGGVKFRAPTTNGTSKDTIQLYPATASTVDTYINNGDLIVQNNNVKIVNLPTSSPGAGSKMLWYNTADNTVKYAP